MQTFKQYLSEAVERENQFPFTPAAKTALMSALRSGDKTKAQKAIEEVWPIIKKVQEEVYPEFLRLIKKETRKYSSVKILSGMKTLPSVLSKAVSRGKSFFQMGDLVRGAILFNDPQEAIDFARKMKRKYSDAITDYEEKERGQDSTFGYFGSAHIGMFVGKLLVEVQVMSKKLWNYKTAAHEIYNQNRENPDAISRGDQAASRRFFTLGNRPSYVREDIDLGVLAGIGFFVEDYDGDFYDQLEEIAVDT